MDDQYIYDFGMIVRMLRENKGWSQQQLAEKLGITKPTVSSYENNYAFPSFEVIKQMAVLFRVTSDYLLGLDYRTVFALESNNEEKIKLIAHTIDYIESMEEKLKSCVDKTSKNIY